MKKIAAIALCVLAALCASSCAGGGLSGTERKIERRISRMTLEEKVWQMFIAAPEDIIDIGAVVKAGDLTKQAIETYPVGGFVLFGKNIESREQTIEMIKGMQSYSKTPLFIAVDEEGGRVSRLGDADVGVTKFPPMAQIGETGDAKKAREVGATLGAELSEMGFNVDFAPVADILTVKSNESIGDRSFGDDPGLVAEMVAAEVEGMQSNGVCATLKHFPCNGSTEADTHDGAGVSARTLEEMRGAELMPFRAGIDAGAGMVMAAHISVPDISGDETPSAFSSAVITDLLRKELGFSGVVVTDALNMGAVTSRYTPEEAALAAVNAGADVLLMSPDAVSAADTLINAVMSGAIAEERIDESVRRILRLKLDRGLL